MNEPVDQPRYKEQLGRMLANAHIWLAEHPGVNVKIQFNFPRKAFIIAPISEAIKNHFVSTDEQGLELLKALWPWDDVYEPTVAMCRAVIETAFEQKRS